MARARKRRSSLSSISILDIASELQRRKADLPELKARYEELSAELEQLRTTIAALGGSSAAPAASGRRTRGAAAKPARAGGKRGGRRAKNEGSLPDALAKVLSGNTMSVSDAAEAVLKSGYKSNSKHFRTMVNIALLNKKRFKRVERGQYTAV